MEILRFRQPLRSRWANCVTLWVGAALVPLVWVSHGSAQEPVLGSTGAHDPSPMIACAGRFYIYSTGTGIQTKSSTDKVNWVTGPQVFSSAPAWTTNAVPGAGNNFWSPALIYLNGHYYLYYSVSTFGSQVSAIGLATSPTLNPSDPSYQWTDQGSVIQSSIGDSFNAIDPAPLLAGDGTLWMSFGSFWTGIKLVQLDPATGKRISSNSTIYSLAAHNAAQYDPIEASFLYQHGGYYYLFVNWDFCCQGVSSTYNIRVGRSTSVTGPYHDRNGVDMMNDGGSMFVESAGRYIGPGQAGIMADAQTNWFTYHYYDGNNNGAATLGIGRLTWSADGWPQLTNDWCAFYSFEADAREHLGVYSGQLKNGATITNETGRGGVVALNGTNQYVTVPAPVANASTFAAWVNWNGGAAWQRVFDFGAGTSDYLFLTPSASNGKLRFAITTNSISGEQTIDAPAALPTGSWQHVAVTLDGARGLLYLNGNPVGTNNNLTIRPWQVLATSNYLGKSQWPADPTFSGRLDSVRIYGRPLSGAEVQTLWQAQPCLAHRYSFTADATDSIGTRHGTAMGAAVITNGTLILNGTSGTYVNLPGGLVSNCAKVTLEFWATFGVNGNWARVFDFGNTNGTSGQQFLFFSPHTGFGSHRFTLSTTVGTSDLDVPGTLDGRSVHVVCIADPTANYSAIYTNGALESALTSNLPPLSGVSSALAYVGRSLYSADAWLNATVDEFRIYDGRLEPDQIARDYALGPDALVAGSPLDAFTAWQMSYFGCTGCPQAQPDADPLGKGLSNTNQFLLGLNPTNSTSMFRIISAVLQGTDINVTWQTAGGRTNVVQAATGDASGSYSNNFGDVPGSTMVISGNGDATTNYTDVGAATNIPGRFYRIRLVP